MHCRLCNINAVNLVIDFGEHPIIHNLLQFPDDSVEKYPFLLGCCENCGFLQLMNPICPEVLYENYFTLSGWKNQPHVSRLINVIESLKLITPEESEVLEIGCNDGSFLLSLQEKGYKKIEGIEPTMDAYQRALSKGLDVYRGFFGEEIASKVYSERNFDLIVTRQVLEHVVNLDDFLRGITFVLKDDGMLVIEVPDSDFNLTYFDYALWEEHVNYFTLRSLSNLLAKHAFTVVHYETTLFSGKALTVFCKKNKTGGSADFNNAPNTLKFELEKISKYARFWSIYREELYCLLNSINDPIAIYGCGARSCNFVNFTGVANLISCFIDDQPEKQGLFVPGSKLKVNEWQELACCNYTFLLGVNAENENKVISKRKLTQDRYFSIQPPSGYLPIFWDRMIHML